MTEPCQQALRPSYLPGCLLVLMAVLILLPSGIYLYGITDETSPSVYSVYLSDLNGDDHLDAFLVFRNELHKVLLNDGNGYLSKSQELLIHNYVLALGDINGDS